MSDRSSRQTFLGGSSGEILAACRVGIIGLGGGGSHIAQQLAHLGIGQFIICDPDRVEDSNLNRLVGATHRDAEVSTRKTAVARRLIKRINPEAQVLCLPMRWQEEGIAFRNCDVIFGCVDSYSERDQIERMCRRFLIPYIDIGMDVTPLKSGYCISGQVILSMPGKLCMWCLGFLNEALLAEEAARYGAAGARPQVIWPNGVLASVAVGVFVQLMTSWHGDPRPAIYLEYDGNRQTVFPSNRLRSLADKRCPHYGASSDLGDPFGQTRIKASVNQSSPNMLDLLRLRPV